MNRRAARRNGRDGGTPGAGRRCSGTLGSASIRASSGLDPLVLELERPLERLGLEPAGELVLVRRVRSLDWVAHHRDDLDARQRLRDPARRMRVEHVVAARLEDLRVVLARCGMRRAVAARGKWPRYQPSSCRLDVEVVDALVDVGRSTFGWLSSARNSDVVPQRWAPTRRKSGRARSPDVARPKEREAERPTSRAPAGSEVFTFIDELP